MSYSTFNKHASSSSGGTLRELSQKKGWRDSLARFGMGALAISLTAFNVASYAADNDLLKGQILYIACNGDVTDQSDMKNPVENNGAGGGVSFISSDRLGKRQRACFFDGSDYLRIPKNPAFDQSNFTIASYVMVAGGYNGEARAIVSNYDQRSGSAAGTYQYYGIGMASPGVASVFYNDGTGLGGAKDGSSKEPIVPPVPLANGEWHHVAAVFQGGVNTKLYVDGVLKKLSEDEAMPTPTSINPTGDLFIGRGGSSERLEKRWVGSIDEVRIFNRALSGDEVSRLSGIIDLPTGETFTPLGTGENDPFLLEVKEGPLTSVMVTPNPEGGFSLNRTPDSVVAANNGYSLNGISTKGLREGERGLPPITSTLVINDGNITLLDEAQPGVLATLNIFGDLEVTDASIPDLKLILPRLDDRFAFLSPSDPSIVVKVNHDGSLEIVDETHPNVSAVHNKDDSYTIVDNDTKTVTLADRNGNAVLTHPDAPGIVATFNIFDSEGRYSLVDTATKKCVEIGGRRSGLTDLGKETANAIKGGVLSAVGTLAKEATQKLLTKMTSPAPATGGTASIATGGTAGTAGGAALAAGGTALATGATVIATKAVTAVASCGSWWATLPALSQFAIAGAAVAGVVAVGAVIYTLLKQKKEIKKLRQEIQVLQATVQQQALQIQQLEQTVAAQAQTIQRLETTVVALQKTIAEQAQKIDEQAEKIAALEDKVARQDEAIAQQAAINAAMQQKIADLEERITRANEGVDAIPDGVVPTATATTKSRHTIRKTAAEGSGLPTSPSECVKLPEMPLVALQVVAAEVVDRNQVVVKWQTLAELVNVGFNIYRASKDSGGQCTNLTKVNNVLIPSQANGVGQNSYTYEEQTPLAGKNYCYGIESVDTEGEAFLFENRVVKAAGPSLATLGDFTAKPAKDSILLKWETMSEEDTAGFNLWRAKAPTDGTCTSRLVADYTEVTKLNDQRIAAAGAFMQGGFYSYKDRQVASKKTYCYGLEEINWEGMSTFYWSWLVPATAR